VVRRALAPGDVDLVHAHNVEGPVVAALFGRNGVPVVWTPHTRMADELPLWFRHGRELLGAAGSVLDSLARWVSDAAVVLGTAGDVAHGLDVEVVPPGIDPADLAGADAARGRALAGEGPFVVYAGNTDRYQDLPDLFAAVAKADARLVVVTPDAAGLPADAPPGLTVVASRRWADARDVLAAAAVAVVPRRLDAGFPMKLLNQVGLGVPTIVTDGVSAPIDGVHVVPAGDPTAMAEAIRRLLDDPDEARGRAAEARLEVLTRWTWDVRGAQLEAFYTRVLGKRS
jgi:glycosyltransferase involved in cell wall biosynthesis